MAKKRIAENMERIAPVTISFGKLDAALGVFCFVLAACLSELCLETTLCGFEILGLKESFGI